VALVQQLQAEHLLQQPHPQQDPALQQQAANGAQYIEASLLGTRKLVVHVTTSTADRAAGPWLSKDQLQVLWG
jgi:hypothetical protein